MPVLPPDPVPLVLPPVPDEVLLDEPVLELGEDVDDEDEVEVVSSTAGLGTQVSNATSGTSGCLSSVTSMRTEMNVPGSARVPLSLLGASDATRTRLGTHEDLILFLGRVVDPTI